MSCCYNCFQEHNAPGPCPHCGCDPAADAGKFPQALPHGTILAGQFITGRVLGQGGFGITYLAKDNRSGDRVALKEFLPDTMAGRSAGTLAVTAHSGDRGQQFQYGLDCFLDEARTLAKFIGNPHIVGVRSYFQENGTAYFTMDYIEGGSLKAYLRDRGGRIGWEEAVRLLLPVMEALEAVHREGLVHRDVTPDNIYITSDGQVKLLDFGAARYSLGDRSRSLDVVLKPGYAPKEQYVRRGRQGPYTDVYSLSACFYAAITGYLPPEALERWDKDEIVLPSARGMKLPPALEDVLLRALEVDAEDRYQTMTEFRDALLTSLPAVEPAPVPELVPVPPEPEPVPVPEPRVQPEPVPIPQPKRAYPYNDRPEPPVPVYAGPPVSKPPIQRGNKFLQETNKGINREGKPKRNIPIIFTAMIAAVGAIVTSLAWTVFYEDTYDDPISAIGGILIAVGIWLIMKYSSRVPPLIISWLSILVGGTLGMGIRIIGDTVKSLSVFAFVGVGGLLAAIVVWLILRKLTYLPIRAIALSSIATGCIIMVLLRICAVKSSIWRDFIPTWAHKINVLPLLVAVGAVLAFGFWLLLRINQSHSDEKQQAEALSQPDAVAESKAFPSIKSPLLIAAISIACAMLTVLLMLLSTYSLTIFMVVGSVLMAVGIMNILKSSTTLAIGAVVAIGVISGCGIAALIYFCICTRIATFTYISRTATFGVGGLLAAIGSWNLLRDLTNMPLRMVAIYSILVGVVLTLVDPVSELIYYIYGLAYDLGLVLICVPVYCILTAGLWLVVRHSNNHK